MLDPSNDSRVRLPTVLVTGFDPFGGAETNPSDQAARALDGRVIAGHQVVAATLPTVFGQALLALESLMQQHRPALVLCCGQAGGRPAISLERVAINVDDARIPDNSGAQPVDVPVVPQGPNAWFTRLPIKAMLVALMEAGVPAEVSQTAGTFVCNHVFYGLMHRLAQPGFEMVRGGLVHVPWLPEQGEPSMPLETIVRGLHVVLECALTQEVDVRVAAGTLD